MWDSVLKKKGLTGLPSAPGKPWEPGAPSLPCSGKRKCSAAFDGEAMRHSLPAFTTYWGASCANAYGPLWSCRPGIASGALKSGRPWNEVYLTSSVTFCLCPTLPSVLQGQQVRLILWLRKGPAHSTQIRTKASRLSCKIDPAKLHWNLRQVPVGLWVPLHPTINQRAMNRGDVMCERLCLSQYLVFWFDSSINMLVSAQASDYFSCFIWTWEQLKVHLSS